MMGELDPQAPLWNYRVNSDNLNDCPAWRGLDAIEQFA
jgi:hypothetical protein